MVWGTFDHANRQDHESERFFKNMEKLLTVRSKLSNPPGVSAGDQQILDDLQRHIRLHDWKESELSCPECSHRMFAMRVTLPDSVDLDLDYCVGCRSYWLDHGELAALTHLPSDVPGQSLAHRATRRPCPVCEQTMDEYQFTRHSNLMVDACPRQHGVYLQEHELDRAFAAARLR